MTQRDYLTSTALVGRACVSATGTDERGDWIVLDRTLFHPQGGGQPADSGTIGGLTVVGVRSDGDEVRHYLAANDSLAGGETIEMEVDAEHRQRNARLHTGGHLIAAIAETQNEGAEAVAGHHWPGEARVEFLNLAPEDREAFRAQLQASVDAAIAADLPVTVDHQNGRSVSIGPHRPVGCGGTHCASLGALGSIEILAVKSKGGKLKVRYDLTTD